MRLPTFSESLAFLCGLFLSVAAAYAIRWQSSHYLRSLPARLSAESIAGFQAIYFARTRQPFPASGTEETLDGARWRIRYAPSAAKTAVTVVGESVPEGYRSEYTFERTAAR